MTTDNQREQLKGYTQAVQEMTAIMACNKNDEMASITIAMEKLKSKMIEKVLILVGGQKDES